MARYASNFYGGSWLSTREPSGMSDGAYDICRCSWLATHEPNGGKLGSIIPSVNNKVRLSMGSFENKPIEKLLFGVMLLSPDLLCGMDVKTVSWNCKDNKRLSEKSAFEDCKELMQDAKEELALSASQLAYHGLEKLSRIPDDLNNCLSAVMSYQQTCIDGFPEGKLKDDTEKALQPCKELASNSLAMVSEVSSLLSRILVPGFGRRLLANESNSPILEKDGLPTWMSHDHRSMFKAQDDNPQPNVTVAKHGTGDYETITEALANMPKLFEGRYVIYVKEGIYEENVTITKKMQNVTMYGDGSQKSIITGSRNFVDGVRTFQTATFAALGDNFLAKSMGFRNTAGPEKHQAVACRVQADRSAFLNCRFEGYQDTLYVQTHRQFYRGCVIAGTIDFIFGDAAVVIQNCIILVRQPMENQQNIVTAQGRIDKRETTGIVLQSCRILADKTLESVQSKMIRSYLGRPWKEYSRTIVMESTIADIIHPDGWMPWDGDFALKTLYYAEFNNTGAGANVDARVKWHGYSVMNKEEATEYTVGPFLQGESWIPALGVPVHYGLYY
ncbi:putative pectinesterase/pectinesterase inhibitor 13 [Morella rubra]|uniref:Pectinesterase n=1 Tax=Morella rubra TaxID=262757 RepID=A0A6A1UUZ2_9ROSI|nr:putative pectinesterase/pectinesterase inhibitor 13 [Morella rubra]